MPQQHAIEERIPQAYAGSGTRESDATLEQLFLELTVRAPGATALLGDEGSLSYSDLLVRAQNVATLLRTRGVQPGDLVGVVAHRSFATISAIVGTLLAGAVYVMFDAVSRDPVSQDKESLRRQVAVSRVRLLLADGSGGSVPDFPWAASTAVVDLQTIEREIMPLFAQMQLPKVAPDGPAAVVFQNDADGVLITHRGLAHLLSSLQSSSDLLHLSAEERLLLHGNPTSHVWHLQLWGALLSGATLVLAPAGAFEPSACERWMHRFSVTALCLETPEFHAMAEEAPYALCDVRQVLIGGAWPAAEDVRRVLGNAPQLRLVYGVGWPETTSYVLAFPLSETSQAPEGGNAPARQRGRALPGVRVAASSSETADRGPGYEGVPGEVSRDESAAWAGQLTIGGAMLAVGYLNDPKRTRSRFGSDGAGRCFLTGEAAQQDEDGSFALRSQMAATMWTQVLTPEEREALVARHPLVLQCAVVPMPQGEPGSCVFVSLRAPDTKGESKIRAHILAHVPQASHPRFLLIMPSLPLDAAGDPDRQRLLEHARTLAAGKGPQAEEATGVLEQVRGVWQRLLHRMQVGVDDDFFAAGGTSVQMIRLHAELNRRFPGAITMADLPALTTIRKVLQHLSTETARDRMGALAKRGA
ncbi:MAG: non-ribosomal peptide synthetase [Acidobacteriaceae bacterium]